MVRGLILCVALGYCATATASSLEEDLKNICTIVANDDKSELRKKMRRVEAEHFAKFRDYYEGITCGGKSLIEHAEVNGAMEVGELMVKRVNSDQLPNIEGSSEIAQAIAKRKD